MSTLLRKSKLIDNCTPSISYDAQIKSACEAFDQQMFEIIDDTGQVIMIPNIMQLTDEKLVDILAWQFHVDFYDHTRDLEFRKKLVQMSIIWHKTKGTVALVREVIDTYWPGSAYLEEWFNYRSHNIAPEVLVASFTAAQVDTAGDKFNVAGLLTGDQIHFVKGVPTNLLPNPIVENVFYYAVNATAGNFQIAATAGGAVIPIQGPPTNTNQIWKTQAGGWPPNYPNPAWHDRYRFRIIVNDDVVDPQIEAQVVELIYRYKPVSRWPETTPIIRPRTSTGNVYVAGYAMIYITRTSKAPINYYIPQPV